MLNIGIVGTGSRGKTFSDRIKNLKCAQGRARIAALCDTNPKRLEAAKKYYEVDAVTYTDYEEFLKHDLDAVIVTTPCDSHAELTIKALEAVG
jgi:predicted dehydrogenase